jgi:hypothetical protein
MADDYTGADAVEDGQEGVAEYGVAGFSRGSLIGGTIAAASTAIAGVILAIPDTFLAPIRAFASGFAALISGTLGAPVTITDAGAETAAQSFLTGTASLLGPLAFPAAVLVSALGVMVFLWFIQRSSISPTQLIRRE